MTLVINDNKVIKAHKTNLAGKNCIVKILLYVNNIRRDFVGTENTVKTDISKMNVNKVIVMIKPAKKDTQKSAENSSIMESVNSTKNVPTNIQKKMP